MAQLKVDTEPDEVGFDAARLARIDDHFRRYVDDGRLAGWTVAVTRRGKVAHLTHHGLADVEAGRAVADDTLWRYYSMTKPITSVAVMMLYERGLLALTDPVSRFIPSFAQQRVYVAGPAANPATVPVTEPMRVWHLLSHTSGLTYGFHHAHPVDEMYRNAGHEFGVPKGMDLAGACDTWAGIPLVFQPGTEWNYSVATDVLGRIVEVVSGKTLDRFFAEEVFAPLGMTDTAFWAAEDDHDRLAALYIPDPGNGGRIRRHDRMGAGATRQPVFLGGGGGLVGTAADYHRFTQMLRRGGELDGERLLGPRTVAYMTRNHLPGGQDLKAVGRPISAESETTGVGFGLGFSVVLDAAGSKSLTSPGEYAWGGLASTAFYVDPVEDVTALFFTQLMPSSTYPIRPQLRTLVQQALVD
ncbi:serine hydrolase domain-containing protein [Pseudonocardia lacus]|uniref:serine hydrolase domain-containing protein n=1 Tax=Pseudonocardia lacus TaxID=2835865 RepID=UPI001BDBD8DD|nr:serine hydrolase domain-containing protein [Pseudonocardia lacus]